MKKYEYAAHILTNKKRAEVVVVEGLDYSGKNTFIDKILKPLYGEKAKIAVLDYSNFKKRSFFNSYHTKNMSAIITKIDYMHRVYSRFIRRYSYKYDYIILNRGYVSFYAYQTLTFKYENKNTLYNFIKYRIKYNKYYIPDTIIYINIDKKDIIKRIKQRDENDYDAFDSLIIKNYNVLYALYLNFLNMFKKDYNFYKIQFSDLESKILDNDKDNNLIFKIEIISKNSLTYLIKRILYLLNK